MILSFNPYSQAGHQQVGEGHTKEQSHNKTIWAETEEESLSCGQENQGQSDRGEVIA